jgi:hypothetical protein
MWVVVVNVSSLPENSRIFVGRCLQVAEKGNECHPACPDAGRERSEGSAFSLKPQEKSKFLGPNLASE